MSTLAEIADAVADTLALGPQGGWPGAVTLSPQRVYLPITDLADTAQDTLVCKVVPAADALSILSRDGLGEEVHIAVALVQRLPQSCDPTSSGGNAFLDPLLALARAVASMYGPQNPYAANAKWRETKFPLHYDVGHLRLNRVFFAVITFVFSQDPLQ